MISGHVLTHPQGRSGRSPISPAQIIPNHLLSGKLRLVLKLMKHYQQQTAELFQLGILWSLGGFPEDPDFILTAPILRMDLNSEIPKQPNNRLSPILGGKIDPKKSNLSWHCFISHPPSHCNHLLHHLLGKMWYSEMQPFAHQLSTVQLIPIFQNKKMLPHLKLIQFQAPTRHVHEIAIGNLGKFKAAKRGR